MGAGLILASASPRRRELLARLGIAFRVVPSEAAETPHPGEAPLAFANRMAREKAGSVARRHSEAFVLGADTIVVVDEEILGKPVDRADARRMLQRLSDRTHQVFTAVALIDMAGRVDQLAIETSVDFRRLADTEIDAYLDSGEPFDKAGAYAVQGGAAPFVRRIGGSYTNVVGLPLDEVAVLLRRRMPWLHD